MALAATLRAGSHSDTDSTTTYVSSSYTPTSNSGLVIVTFTANGTVIPPYTVPTGGSLTYKPELSLTYSGATPPVRRIEVFSVQVGTSPGSIQTTFTLNDGGGGSTSSIGFGYAIVEFTDQNTVRLIQEIRWTAVSLNPSSPATGTSTGGITMPSAIDTDNRPFSWNTHRSNQATTFTTNWTELLDATGTTPAAGIQAQWRSDAYDTANGVSWGGSAAAFSHIAMEINHSATTPVNCARIVNWRDTSSVADSTVSVNMPINISSGDLLIATGSIDTNATCNDGASEGWTEITNQASGTQCRLKILAKLAAGGDTLSPTLGAAVDSAWTVMRITDHGVSNVATDIIVGTAATGTSTTPNPPSASPGSTKDWLVIPVAASDDDDNVAAGSAWAPTDYFEVTQVESAASTSSSFVQIAGRRINTGSAVDPGTFTLNASEEWAAQTLLIPPAPSNATATPSQASGTGSAGAPTISAAGNSGAALVEGSGTAGSPGFTASGTAIVNLAEGTGTAQAPSFIASSTITVNTAEGTGTAGVPNATMAINSAVDTANGTGTADAPSVTASGATGAALVTGSGTAGSPGFTASGTVTPPLAEGAAVREYAWFPDTDSNDRISAPDDPPCISNTDDVDIIVRFRRRDWSANTIWKTVLSKWSPFQPNDFDWLFNIQKTASGLRFQWSTFNDSTSSAFFTGYPSTNNGAYLWARMTWRFSDKRLQFFTAPDQVAVPSSWTQLGADQTYNDSPNQGDNPTPIWLGADEVNSGDSFDGRIAYCSLAAAIDGSPVYLFDPAEYDGGPDWVASTGQTLTIDGDVFLSPGFEPTITVGQTALPDTATGTGAAQAPTVSASGNGTTATVEGSGTAGAPDFVSSATVEPGTGTGTGSAGAPTITASGDTGAGTVTGSGTAGAPGFSASALVEPNTGTGTGTSDTPTIITEDGGAETAAPGTVVGTGTAFTPSITTTGNASGGSSGTGSPGSPVLSSTGNVAPTQGAGVGTAGGFTITVDGTVLIGVITSGTPGAPDFSTSSTITPATFIAIGTAGVALGDVVLPLRLRTRYRVEEVQPMHVSTPSRNVPADCCTKVERPRWRV